MPKEIHFAANAKVQEKICRLKLSQIRSCAASIAKQLSKTLRRYIQATLSSNAKFREMGPFSLKIDIKTSGTTFDLIKNASESFWKFGLLTLRPFGLWPLRPS